MMAYCNRAYQQLVTYSCYVLAACFPCLCGKQSSNAIWYHVPVVYSCFFFCFSCSFLVCSVCFLFLFTFGYFLKIVIALSLLFEAGRLQWDWLFPFHAEYRTIEILIWHSVVACHLGGQNSQQSDAKYD